MNLLRHFIPLLVAALWVFAPAQAATILPPPETCFQATTSTSGGPSNTGTGFIGLLGTITPGSGGTSGTYFTVLTGGSGTNASASITVSGGAVTAVNIYNPGTGYVVGDVLSAASGNIGNVGGFSVPISSVSINQALAGGQVYTYVPNTTSPKTTWFNADQASNHQNTNPVQLDANGCAIIYGIGSYQFVVEDSLGNIIYSQVTTDTSASNSVFWAGLAGGTPNTITLTDANFNGTAGSVINFKVLSNNTGPTTINPSGFGAIPVTIGSNIGPIPLVGGELAANDVATVVYDNVANSFYLTNPVSSSSGGGGSVPVGTEISCAGFAALANFVFEYGQAVSRSTFASLFAQLTTSQTGVLTSGNNTVTGLTDTEQFTAGQFVEGSGIPAATTILSVTSGSSITLSANATANGTAVIRFFAYPNGDGATTFNVPDRRGRVLVGRDNMGDSVAGILTSTYTTSSPDALGSIMQAPAYAAGGGLTFVQANLPSINFTIPSGQGSHSHSLNPGTTSEFLGNPGTGGTTYAQTGGGSGPPIIDTFSGLTQPSTLPGMVAASGGSGTPLSPINPGMTTNMCLRVQ